MVVSVPRTTGSVTSADGTTIGYLRLGERGPGVVLVHGGLERAESHLELAEQLSDDFTLVIETRGQWERYAGIRTGVLLMGAAGARLF